MQPGTPNRAPKSVQIHTWEGEGGAVDAFVFGRPRPLHRRAASQIERVVFKLKRRVREEPIHALALAIGLGLLVGSGARTLVAPSS